jgi:hypothetical protein
MSAPPKILPPERRWFDIHDAAEYTGFSIQQIRRFIAQGLLVAYRPGEQKLVLDKIQIDQFISDSASKPYKCRPQHFKSKGVPREE